MSRQVLLFSAVLALATGVGMVFGMGFAAGKWAVVLIGLVGLLGLGPFVLRRFGVPPFIAAFAGLCWSNLSVSYGSLLNVSLWEIAAYCMLLAFTLGVFSQGVRPAWGRLWTTPGLLPIAFLLVAAVVASLSGPQVANQIKLYYLRRTMLYGLAIYLVVANSLSTPKEAIHVMGALVLGGLVFSGQLSFVINGSWDPVQRIMGTRDIGYSFLGREWNTGPVPLATYISLTLSVAAALALNSDRIGHITFFSAAAVVLATLLILTEGRASFVATGVSLGVIVMLSMSKNRTRLWKIALFGVLLVMAMSALVSSGLLNQSLSTRLQGFSNPAQDTNMLTRIRIWRSTTASLLAHPLGLGFGYWVATRGYSAHNDFIDMALGSGFFGLVCYLLFLLQMLIALWRGLKARDRATRGVCVAAIACCVAYLINSMGDSPSVNSIWSWQLLWIVLASAVGILRRGDFKHLGATAQRSAP